MKNLNNFKTFESKEPEYLDYLTIKDLFIDLIDDGYEMNTFNENFTKIGKYFFEFKKSFPEERFGYFDDGHAYGYSDLDGIKSEVEKSLMVLEESRSRLNDLGYNIGFEFEFNFSLSSMVTLICHMHHSSHEKGD